LAPRIFGSSSTVATLAFKPYVTSPNVLAASLDFNKNPNVLNLSLLMLCLDWGVDLREWICVDL